MVSFRVIVDKLKSNFLLRKFKKSVLDSVFITELNNIVKSDDSLFLLEDEIIINRFENIRIYICKKDVIAEAENILNNYYRWYKYDPKSMFKLTSKHLLSAWMIHHCPTIILGNLDSNEKYYLSIFAEKLINNLINLTNITDFNKTILHYTDCMNIFLEQDKIDKINNYTAEWISLDKSYEMINKSNRYDPIQKELIFININKDKKLIEKHIKIYIKNFDSNKLKKIIEISQNIAKKIIESYKVIIKIDICGKNYDICSKLLNDIKKFILIFNKNNYYEINEHIDTNYFIDLLKNDVIKIYDIKIFGDYLIKKICGIGSISSEEENMIKWNEIKNNYNNDYNNDSSIAELIAEMFIFSLELIEIIKNELLDYEYIINIIS
jgi:hypothetical protein